MKRHHTLSYVVIAMSMIAFSAAAQDRPIGNIPNAPNLLVNWTGAQLKPLLNPAAETGLAGECPNPEIATFDNAHIYSMMPDAGGDYTPQGQRQSYLVGNSMTGKVNDKGDVAILCWKDTKRGQDLRYLSNAWLIPQTSKLRSCYFPDRKRVICTQ